MGKIYSILDQCNKPSGKTRLMIAQRAKLACFMNQ